MKNKWKRFIPAVQWELRTDRQRRENPKSILDVMPIGWSEIRYRFEELMTKDPIQDRMDYDKARKHVLRKKP